MYMHNKQCQRVTAQLQLINYYYYYYYKFAPPNIVFIMYFCTWNQRNAACDPPVHIIRLIFHHIPITDVATNCCGLLSVLQTDAVRRESYITSALHE